MFDYVPKCDFKIIDDHVSPSSLFIHKDVTLMGKVALGKFYGMRNKEKGRSPIYGIDVKYEEAGCLVIIRQSIEGSSAQPAKQSLPIILIILIYFVKQI